MTISINWATKVISVPKADTTLIQSEPTEIRELNLNTFRLWLKDIEDSEEGMPHLDTHRHNTEVTLGGVVLARVVEIINGYTVTFEDGQYAVNLVGANSNVGDVINVNQVSVRSFNSAGLTSSPAIEFASFEGGVWIDTTSSTVGTIYPSGTHLAPVNNFTDAQIIASYRGLNTLFIIGDAICNGHDLDGRILIGENPILTTITLSGCSTEGTEFSNATITGTLDGAANFNKCHLGGAGGLTGFAGGANQSVLTGDITLAGTNTVQLLHCYSGVPGDGTPVMDMNGDGPSLGLRAYTGGIQLENKTGSDSVSLDFISGQAIIDSTVTNGTIVIRGVAKVTDNSTGSAVVDISNVVNPYSVADQTWDEAIADHEEVGSTGKALGDISAGASPEQIADAVWNEAVADHLSAGSIGEAINMMRQINAGKLVIDPVASTITIYAANDVDILKVFDIKKLDGQPAGEGDDVYQRVPQ